MPRIVAIDWDQHEIRYVLAQASGGRVALRAVGAQPLVDISEGSETPRPDLEGSLRALLSDPLFAGARIVIAVERSRIELLHLQLPPANDRELPDLVLHQVVRELQLSPEQIVVDFVPLEGDALSRRKVMAAVLSREELNRILALLKRMKLRPVQMVFRPLSAAALLLRLIPNVRNPALVINRVGLEADLSLLVDSRPVFSRTIRLPEASVETQRARLVLEAERTVTVAAAESLGRQKLAAAYVFGLPGEHSDLVERLSEQLGVPVELVDPFQSVSVGKVALPENAGRFSVHIGMIMDVATGRKPDIDFLHVRRPPGQLKKSHIALAAAAVVLLFAGYGAWNFAAQYTEISRENAALEAELKELNQTANKAAQQQRLVRAVSDWLGSEIVWLDELADLSLQLPASRHLVLSRFTATVGSGSGSIFLQGFVRDPRILQQLEYAIRDQYRRVQTPRLFEREIGGERTWSFESSLVVARRQPAEYLLSRLKSKLEAEAPEESLASQLQAGGTAGGSGPEPSGATSAGSATTGKSPAPTARAPGRVVAGQLANPAAKP
jgi:Tfp pilus assembly PilM family ATPase